jgi:enoyl-CoA hydratase
LTLNRPQVLNAFDEEMLQELVGALETIVGSGQPLIFTGAGRAFSTGGDLKAYLARLDDREALRQYFLLLADVFGRIIDYPGVTVAAVNAVTVAGGLELICACDVAVGGGWRGFVDDPGPAVIGVTQEAGCMGAAYEFLSTSRMN